jgi:cytochrome c oxidase cbb3-type subunit 1
MTAPASDSSSVTTVSTPAEEPAARFPLQTIDLSCRWPVLGFLSQATIWLLISLVCLSVVAIKLHVPNFLADISWLTVGRLRPAAMNALIYGFLFQAAIPVVLWILCRMGGVPLLNRSLILFAGALWNLGLTIGFLAILAGKSSGFTWMEMPVGVGALLFAAYAFIGIWALITFHYRQERQLYVSQWYFVAALFVFPWIYSAANYLLLYHPVRGAMQIVVSAWYASNLLWLFFSPIALGTIFYFLPKLLGRPLYSRSLALLGFWAHLFAATWTGLASFVGAPLPVWMIAASVSFNILMIVPLLAVAMNWHMTALGRYQRAKSDPVLRFILCSAIAFIIGSVERIASGFPAVARFTELTFMGVAWTQLMLLGFVGLSLFGALYYIVPRVAHIEWPSAKLSRMHFGLTVAGVALYFVALSAGGFLQGVKMQDPAVDIIRIMKMTVPFVGLGTLATLLLLAGQVAFALNFGQLIRKFCRAYCPPCCSWIKLGSESRSDIPSPPSVEVRL